MLANDDPLLPFSLPNLCGKKITAGFDGGTISSDGGVILLAGADKRLRLTERLAALIPDSRNPDDVTHTMTDLMRARVYAIACGYPDANDLTSLRYDPAFKLACGRLPESGEDLTSQPTLSRWENPPDLRTWSRMNRALVDLWCQSYRRPPEAITLDIDDTANIAHGHQQLSLFNAHHDEQCFMPVHVYDAASGHCVMTVLRPGQTPDGNEVRAHVRRLVRRIRMHWPDTWITIRGDSHYGRPEAMEWCEQNGVQYIFGLATNTKLAALVETKADEVRARRATGPDKTVRDYTEITYGAKKWKKTRRVVARIEASPLGLDIRYVVTNIVHCAPQWVYESLYCARGGAENLIKRHKGQLASDRTSCRSPLANQMRLFLHTVAYWLMRAVQDAVPVQQPLARGDFNSLRLRLLKVAVRVKETASRVRLAFTAGCPDKVLFRGLVGTLILRPT